MPSAGLQIFGAGLKLQPVTPGTQDQGNANITGIMRASRFTTSQNDGASAEDEIFGHNLTLPGSSNNNVCFGNNNLVGNLGQVVVFGYNSKAYNQNAVALGNNCTVGFSGANGARCAAVGNNCKAADVGPVNFDMVAFGSDATARGISGNFAFGVASIIQTTNVSSAIGGVIGYNVSFNNSGHRDVLGIGMNITENAARQNVLVIGVFDPAGPAGSYPGIGRNNAILLGNQNQTFVKIGAYVIDSQPVNAAFRQTANATVANTAAETTLTGAGVGSLTIPADRLSAGSTIRLIARGVIADTGTPTLRLRVKLGSTTFLDFGAVTFPTLTGTHGWELEGEIVIRTAGAGGTAIGNGCVWVSVTGAPDLDTLNTATSALDTTAAQALDITAQWGTANPANTITCTHLTMEIL